MSDTIEELDARADALEARVAALEAELKLGRHRRKSSGRDKLRARVAALELAMEHTEALRNAGPSPRAQRLAEQEPGEPVSGAPLAGKGDASNVRVLSKAEMLATDCPFPPEPGYETPAAPAPGLREAAEDAIPLLEGIADSRGLEGWSGDARRINKLVAALRDALAREPAPEAENKMLDDAGIDRLETIFMDYQGEYPPTDAELRERNNRVREFLGPRSTPAPVSRGEVCDLCGTPVEVVYRVPDLVWKQIHERAPAGLLCPVCAHREARARGIDLWWEAAAGHYPSDALASKTAEFRGRPVEEWKAALDWINKRATPFMMNRSLVGLLNAIERQAAMRGQGGLPPYDNPLAETTDAELLSAVLARGLTLTVPLPEAVVRALRAANEVAGNYGNTLGELDGNTSREVFEVDHRELRYTLAHPEVQAALREREEDEDARTE